MRTFNTYYHPDSFVRFLEEHHIRDNSRLLVQVFTGLTDKQEIIALRDHIHTLLPQASIIGATTDGEICEGMVTTYKSVVSISQFEDTRITTKLIEGYPNSFTMGEELANSLFAEDTRVLITFSDGLHCNGEAFVQGLRSQNDTPVIAGGMAGDNAQFQETFVFNQTAICSNGAVGAALHNPRLFVHSEYSFDWTPIGQEMTITHVEENRIYTINNHSAYETYRHYLGDAVARQLPAIGIEFPLIIQRDGRHIARAVLSKHDDGSLSFAGNFLPGDRVRFGYGNVETLLQQSQKRQENIGNYPMESLFIYSCMARRRFMPKFIEEEILPYQHFCNVSGFFTYGEFYAPSQQSWLLNETTTILALSESPALPSFSTRDRPALENLRTHEHQQSLSALSHLLDISVAEMEEKHLRLEAKQASLQQAQEIGHFGSWEVDLDTQKALWSKESYIIYGIDPRSIQPTLNTFMQMVLPEERDKVSEMIKEARDGKVKTLEVKAKRPDGKIITLLINGKILFDDKGVPKTLVGTTLDITEQVKLKAHNEELASIIENSSNEIYIVEKGTYRYLYVNRAALETLGYTREEMSRMTLLDINRHISLKELRELEQTVISQGTLFNRTIHTRKDGTTYHVQSYVQHRHYLGKEVAIIFDIDMSRLIESEQRQKQQAQILEQIQDSVISTDLDDIITHWNMGAQTIHGYSAEEMLGKPIRILYPREEWEKLKWMKQQALLHGAYQGEIQKVTKSGDLLYTHVSISVLRDENNRIIGLTRYSQDITHKKETERKLQEQTELLNFQAFHDTLTRLPNRALFEDRLQQSIAHAQKHQKSLGLLFIDLDNFKQINDTLGHQFGDEVLKVVAKRLIGCIGKEDTLARLGGDEFTILVRDLKSPQSASGIAQRIINALKPKIVLKQHELHLTASIGISLYPKDSNNITDLFKYADTAMYKAKDEGRNTFRFYSEEMTHHAFEKAMLELNLRKAIDNHEFTVYYQPQIDARDNKVVGVEALVRWHHPHMGLIMPDRFIPIAEESHIIKELDTLVMKQAIGDVQEWIMKGYTPGGLSLNISIKQLMDKNFLKVIKETIAQNGFDSKMLELEITENQMMHDPKKSVEILHSLHDMGIQVAIDDFGTGYSSLTYLKRLPVNTLKIDRAFIKDLPHDEEDRAISKAIIALGKTLHLSIVAEGAERYDQVEYLLENGCYYIQGDHYAKPMPKHEMLHFLKKNRVINT